MGAKKNPLPALSVSFGRLVVQEEKAWLTAARAAAFSSLIPGGSSRTWGGQCACMCVCFWGLRRVDIGRMGFSSILYSHRPPVVSSDRVSICLSLLQHKPPEPIQPSAPTDLRGDCCRNSRLVLHALQCCTKIRRHGCHGNVLYSCLCEDFTLTIPTKPLNPTSTLKPCLDPQTIL